MPTDSAGRKLAVNLRGGVSPINALTGSGYASQTIPLGASQDSNVLGEVAGVTPVTNIPTASPAWWMIAFVAILVILHIAGRHPKLGEVTENYSGVNVWNFVTGGLQFFMFLLALKLGVNKFAPQTTLANVVNFV